MKKPTIGFISTWPIYQGTTIDRYAYSLIQGISSAASRMNCNLLIGCGSNILGNDKRRRRFWPVPGPDVEFLPVGPWNTDGLLIVPDELSSAQLQYIDDLIASGFPVVYTTPEGPGPLVKVDNALGIRCAVSHLKEHGHQKIAFIAGHFGRHGDSEERLKAFHSAMEDYGLSIDEQLIDFGEHRRQDGAEAMKRILQSGASFSAVIASNDLSCLGAMDVLQNEGLKIPQDVAVIGFDDILDARSLTPSLTTIRHPTFALGYQSVLLLLAYIKGERHGNTQVVVPPQLIIRQSCGCQPGEFESGSFEYSIPRLAHEMADAALIDARNSLVEDLEQQFIVFLNSYILNLEKNNPEEILNTINRGLKWTEEQGEDAHIWQTAIAFLLKKVNTLLAHIPNVDPVFATSLLDRVRLEISDQIQRQITRSLLGHMDMNAQLGQLTAEMLAAMSIEQSAEILTQYLPQIGIQNALVVLYDPEGEDPTAQSKILFGAGLPNIPIGQKFNSHDFPITEIYPSDIPFQLTILPLDVDEKTTGFVAFNAKNPEMCAAIVLNLGVALRTNQLYQDALEGRRQAEEANRLKSRFLSMVSHELRTPLSLIIGLSEMSLKDQKIEMRDLSQINTSAQHLARLIGDVLDLASSEAGQLRIMKEPLDLEEVLRVAIKLGEELAHEKGLDWNVNCPHHGPWVLGDRTRLRQITLNLISNAVKFTSSGKVQIDVEKDEQLVTVSVSDTGMGIKKDELETIFNEFYRTESSIQSGVGGIGLGLAITKQLVEQHGGSINFTSPGKLGCGTTFSFSLPMIHAFTANTDLITPLPVKGSILVFLTEKSDSIDHIEKFLKSHDYDLQTIVIDDNPQWLSWIIAIVPGALILSEHLAARQGWTIAEILKRQSITENIPILAFSLNENNNTGEILELNYMRKPLEQNQLSNEISQFLTPTENNQTVLIVDDDPGILDMHSRMIEQTGRKVLLAHHGREALSLLETHHPDLILLDLMMPEMDGFETLEILRTRESLRDIPVIILTARVLTDTDLDRCNRGVASILGKGLFSTEETLNHIEAALTRQNSLGGATRQLVRRAMTYIHSHYSEQISRENIADHIGISADYLTDCFHQELRITPSTYIRRYRIRQACELLRNTTLSITQIGMDIGFSESSHFTRTFFKETGMTPKAYRLKKQR